MTAIAFTLIHREARRPIYSSDEAAGADLCSTEFALVQAGESLTIPTGLILAIPEGFEGQVRPRSGLAAKHKITVLNAPGTIDSDYRGEVKVILFNHGQQDFSIAPGDRIAQLVIAPVVRAEFTRFVGALDETERGAGGFGSTGVSS